MSGDPVVIIGAGPAGLSAAEALTRHGAEVYVGEREPVVGGLAATLRQGGNFYGHGFHALHDDDPEFLAFFRRLAGDGWREFPRDVAIRLRGREFEYPLGLSGFLRGFPLGDSLSAVAGFLAALVAAGRTREEPGDAEEALVRLYGRPLYRLYFAAYTEKFWGRPASAISPGFVAARLPRFQPAEKLRALLGGFAKGPPPRLTEIGRPVMATTVHGSGGIYEALAREVAARGSMVRTDLEAVEILARGRRIEAVRFRTGETELVQPCRALVSTMPIGRLAGRLTPRPPVEIQGAADRLSCRGLLTVGLLVEAERVLRHALTYFHGRIFHRLSEPKACGVEVSPGNRTVLLAEVTADPTDGVWNDPGGLIDRTVRDLEIEGLLQGRDVVEARVFTAPEAYPFFGRGFERDLVAVRDYLEPFENLASVGRQGTFSFLRSAEAMKAARDAALRPGFLPAA